MAERPISGKEMLLYRSTSTFVVASVTADAGTGYDSTPTVSFTGGGGTGATATAVMTGTGGSQSVASITITNAGTGYTTAPTVVFTGGTPATPAAGVAVISQEYKIVSCVTQHDLDQTSSTQSTDTFCGKISLDGTKDAKVSFSFVIKLSPEATKVAVETLQADYKSGNYHNWKMTNGSASGDMIWTFSAFMESLKFAASASDHYNGSASLQLDQDGADLEIII